MDAKPIKGRNGPYPKFSSEILTIPYFSFSPNFVIHIENLSNPNRKQLISFILKIFLKVWNLELYLRLRSWTIFKVEILNYI